DKLVGQSAEIECSVQRATSASSSSAVAHTVTAYALARKGNARLASAQAEGQRRERTHACCAWGAFARCAKAAGWVERAEIALVGWLVGGCASYFSGRGAGKEVCV